MKNPGWDGKEELKMKIPVLLTTLGLVFLSLCGRQEASTCSTVLTTPPLLHEMNSTAGQPETRFSSTYTALTKCGSGMKRKEEKEAEKQ